MKGRTFRTFGTRGAGIALALWLSLALNGIPIIPVTAEPWSGILDPSRAIDWSRAGIAGGIPNRTTICATLNPGSTAAEINDAVTACPAEQVVFLAAGTFNLDAGIILKTDVTLRGAGANQTKLVFNGT